MAVPLRRIEPKDVDAKADPSLIRLNELFRQIITEINRLGGSYGTISLIAPVDMGGNPIQNLSASPAAGSQDAVGREFADTTYATTKTAQQIATQLGLSVSSGATGAQGRQTVTGSKGGNAALTSLLTALAKLGIIIDQTT